MTRQTPADRAKIKSAYNYEYKEIKDSKHVIALFNGQKLQYHLSRNVIANPENLKKVIPEKNKNNKIQVEIGPGKGKFLKQLALTHPNHFCIGIDIRKERIRKTNYKLTQNPEDNWTLCYGDARAFALNHELPSLHHLHIYHPDPWPKTKHHKHRFFRSPEAKVWAEAIEENGFLSLSTDCQHYFFEILNIIKTWDLFNLIGIYEKQPYMKNPQSFFEGLFLDKNEKIWKAHFQKKSFTRKNNLFS